MDKVLVKAVHAFRSFIWKENFAPSDTMSKAAVIAGTTEIIRRHGGVEAAQYLRWIADKVEDEGPEILLN